MDNFFRKLDGRMTKLPDVYVKKSDVYGSDFCENLSDFDRARASNDAENKPELQGLAKAGEGIFHLEFGQRHVLENKAFWQTLGKFEKRRHYDGRVGVGKNRIDVKTIAFHKCFLIWPKNKGIKELRGRDIEGLALVKAGKLWDGLWGYTHGWIRKSDFLKKHQIANGDDIGPGLDKDTPFVHEDILSDPALLLEYRVKV